MKKSHLVCLLSEISRGDNYIKKLGKTMNVNDKRPKTILKFRTDFSPVRCGRNCHPELKTRFALESTTSSVSTFKRILLTRSSIFQVCIQHKLPPFLQTTEVHKFFLFDIYSITFYRSGIFPHYCS